MKSHLFFSFTDHAFGVVSKYVTKPKVTSVSLMLSSRRFRVLHFTFRSMIHFELIFAKGLSSVTGCPVIPVPFAEKIIYALLNCLCSLVKDQLSHLCGSISEFSTVQLIYLSLLSPIPYCRDYYRYTVSLET